jgi:hypothetical protein
MTDDKLDKLIEKRKWGGARVNAGRKSKLAEDELMTKLHPMANDFFIKMHERIKEGDIKALQLFAAYYIGLPTQKIESKIEGNLNQIAIEIIKPNILIQESKPIHIEDKDNM